MTDSDDSPEHLGRDETILHWDWSGENPVEIILLILILVLFFMLPRGGCGIEKTDGSLPSAPPVDRPINQGE